MGDRIAWTFLAIFGWFLWSFMESKMGFEAWSWQSTIFLIGTGIAGGILRSIVGSL